MALACGFSFGIKWLNYLIIGVIHLLFTVLITWSFWTICNNSKAMSKTYLFAFSFTLILFVIDSVSCAAYAILVSDHCFDADNENPWILTLMVFGTLSMILALVTLYTIFCFRLIHTFTSSMFEFSNTMKKYLHCTCAIQFFLAILAWLTYPIPGVDAATVTQIVSVLIQFYILNSIVLTIIFTKKLKVAAKTIESLQRNISCIASASHNNSTENSTETKIQAQTNGVIGVNKARSQIDNRTLSFIQQTVNIASKVVLCVFFALFSSFLLSIVFVCIATIESPILSLGIGWAMMVDSFVNTLCLVLQWGFSHILYTHICTFCDKFVKKIVL